MLGFNTIVDVWAQQEGADDASGGSVRTDVVRYEGVLARIANDRPSADLRVQGIELPRTLRIMLWPDGYSAIRADDIVIPRNGPWAGQRLRVTGIQQSSLPVGHPRSHIQLTAIHTDYADREE